MKKRLLCLLLILIVAFSLSACDVSDNTAPEPEYGDASPEYGFVDGGAESGTPNLGEDDRQSPNRDDSEYSAPDFGEKGYVEHIYDKLYPADDAFEDKTLITSVNELDEFFKVEHIQESVLFPSDYTGSRDTVYTRFNDKVASYTSEYFENNALIVIFKYASSGSYQYTVKNVEIEESTVTVTLQYWCTADCTCDMNYWGIIIECPKGDFDKLNVVTEIKEQQIRPNGVGLYIALTHEASLETIYKIYTAEDFPELDFDFTVEDFSEGLRNKIGQLLNEHTLEYWEKYGNYWNRETIMNYTRMLVIKLTVESKENVLRAVELLSQRADVKWAEPVYDYYFEMD